MTVLQSLLSGFRKSRSSVSRLRNNRRSHISLGEGLEERLLLVNPVTLSSNPGAPVTIYLDFDGHTETDAGWIAARNDGSTANIDTPAFDSDGDTANFSAAEIDQITEIWERVSEDFRPFNINVTTLDPGVYNDFQAVLVSIGGDGAWYNTGQPTTASGVSFYGFADAAVSNTNFVFSDVFSGGANFIVNTASTVSHEVGHMLGLRHHSTWNPDGSLNQEYDPGNAEIAPIMGFGGGALRDLWQDGLDNQSSTSTQDDLAVITGPTNQTISFRQDDHGNTLGTASSFAVGPGDEVLNGIIGQNSDVDLFRFTTLSTSVTISITGLDLTTQFAGVTNPGSNLDPVLTLLDAGGNVIATDDPVFAAGANASLKASISTAIGTGDYYIQVSNRGDYGNLGWYEITVQGVDAEPVGVSINNPRTIREPNPTTGIPTGITVPNSGPFITTGRVTRPTGQPTTTALTVTLINTDPSEIIIPATVTIPAGQTFATFPITAINDNLLDGDQSVFIQAEVSGVFHSQAAVTVRDHEFLTVEFNHDPIREDGSDSPAATVTITRSNDDVNAANHWVSVNNELQEWDPSGTTLLQTIPVEWPGGGMRPIGEDVKDIQVLRNGNIAVYNGTDTSTLSVYNTTTAAWIHYTIAGMSGSATDPGAGGLASFGNYIFLTDLETATSPEHGLIRLDLVSGQTTRFANNARGARLFAERGLTSIVEIDPITGDTINTIALSGFSDGVAFDGTSLWVLFSDGTINGRELQQINPDTGAVISIHNLAAVQERNLDGLTYMNGLIYLYSQSSSVVTGASIEAYDPTFRIPVGNVLALEVLNGISLDDNIGSLPSLNRLLFKDSTLGRVYHINPTSGFQTFSFAVAQPFSFFSGITSISDISFGGGTLNNLIYLESSTFNSINVYSAFGSRIDVDPSTPAIDPLNVTGTILFGDLGGADVPGVTSVDLSFRDVAVGLDGRVYGLTDSGNALYVYDPNTLAFIESITLDNSVYSIAVDEQGIIYGGDDNGVLRVFSSSGLTTAVLDTTLGAVTDIDTNVSDQILFSDIAGQVARVSQLDVVAQNLGAVEILENVGSAAFTSFGRHQTISNGDLVVNLQSNDLTELQVPAQVIIPVGSKTVTVPLTVVDDNFRDGDQTVTITATAQDYVTGTNSVVVQDVEEVIVDVIATEVREDAGTGATQIRVSRTDVDGPLDFLSAQSYSNNQPVQILDNDIVESSITVPNQVSVITDVDVTLSLTHGWIPDLDVFLVSPTGTRIELFTDLTTNENQITNLTLDDEAATRVVNGTAPYTGRFRPEQPLELARLDGENPSGIWTLEITDDSAQDIGQLHNWTLSLMTAGLAPLTVTLSSSDTTEATVPATVVIPANQSEVIVDLNAVDDTLLDGTQTVTITPTSVNLPGFELIGDTVDVTDVEYLDLALGLSTVREDAGAAAFQGTVSRLNTNIGSPLTVLLSSSDTSELAVPASVIIPAGQTSVSFDVDVLDDTDFETPSPVVMISASAVGYINTAVQSVTVQDIEPTLLVTTPDTSVLETAGTMTVIVTRINPLDITVAQQFTLTSNDITELSFSGAASTSQVIPANSTSVLVTVTVVDDALLDGTQTVRLTASGAAINPGSLDVAVGDVETITLTVNQTEFLENGGSGLVQGTVTVSNTDRSAPLTVNLTSSDTTEATVPAQVTIPAGSASVNFTITPVNDPDIDGSQPVTITASTAGYVDGTLAVTVLDHEPPVLTGPTFQTGDPTPTIEWQALPGAQRYDLWVNYVSGGISQIIRVEDIPASQTSYTAPQELAIGRYRAWIRAYDALERPGFWSVGRDFIVRTAPQFTAPASTSGIAFSEFPELSWSDVVDTTRYDLWVRNLTTGEDQVIREQNLTTTNFQTMLDLPGAEYRAWVRAYVGANAGFWSAPIQFAVLAAPDVLTPVGLSLSRSPIFTWDPISGADHYEIWLSNRESSTLVVRDRFVTSNTYQPPFDLADEDHVIWVRAVSSNGTPSEWSAAHDFTVMGDPEFGRPAILSPVQNATTGSNPTFTWSEIAGINRYEIWVNRTDVLTARVIHNTSVPTTSYTSGTALDAGTYRVWIRAIDSAGGVSAWSAGVDFTVVSADVETSDVAAPLSGMFASLDVSLNETDEVTEAVRFEAPQATAEQSPEDAESANTRRAVRVTEAGQPVVRTMSKSQPQAAELATEIFDRVMADWDSADWWTGNSDEEQV
jgi:subtilisin-like proprotein convertase family protein